jgi:hypothetical protein
MAVFFAQIFLFVWRWRRFWGRFFQIYGTIQKKTGVGGGLRLFFFEKIWASRFGAFRASRRAIRSITFAPLRVARWFRCYPSRKNALYAVAAAQKNSVFDTFPTDLLHTIQPLLSVEAKAEKYFCFDEKKRIKVWWCGGLFVSLGGSE